MPLIAGVQLHKEEKDAKQEFLIVANAHQKAKCLYYPYSRTTHLSTLKKATLLFDEIVFLDSQPWFIRKELIRDQVAAESPALTDGYDYLIDKGLAKFRDPGDVIQGFDPFLTANVVNDLRSDDFCKEAIGYDVTVWDILTERIPPTFLEVFYPGAGTFSEAISLQALIKANGRLEEVPKQFRQFAEFRWGSQDLDTLWQAFRGRYKFVIGGNPHMRLESYEIPFLQASSLRINEALLVSGMEGLVPFTDSKIHDRLLRLKINNSLSTLSNNPELRERLEVELPTQLPQQHLAVTILDRLLPKEELEKRSLKEIVEYRLAHADQFRRFHNKVAELATEIGSVKPSPDYQQQVRRIVDSKVVPELVNARDELMTEYEKSFGQLVLKSAKVIIPTIVVTAFAGLGIWEVLGACALAEIGMMSAKGAENLLESWRARKRYARTAFAYLANL